MDFGIAFASISNAIGIGRQLLAVKEIANNAEAKLLVADLQLALADTKTRMAELMEEKLALADELKQAKSESELVFKDGVYYKPDGDGPYCPTCQDKDGKRIRLTPQDDKYAKWWCKVCRDAVYK